MDRAKSSVVKQVEDAVEDLAKKTATPTHLLIDHPAPDGRDRPTVRTISRADLVRIVDKTTQGLTESTRDRLLNVARAAEAVAVGWFHCDGVGCPARQARRPNQRFQQAFDYAMYAHFGVPNDEIFVARVEADPSAY